MPTGEPDGFVILQEFSCSLLLLHYLRIITTYSEQDFTLNLTNDTMVFDEGFATTNAADLAVNINQDPKSDAVSGHVIFNQVGSCTIRRNHTI